MDSFWGGFLIGAISAIAIMALGVWLMVKNKQLSAKSVQRGAMIAALVTVFVVASAFGHPMTAHASAGVRLLQSTPVPLIIPTDQIFTSTNDWMTTFAPIAAIGIGISIALAVLGYLGKMIKSAFN